jgi:succinate-semialdehyde dehydrogenase/glutarate-semialdehyde dehydrogenase
VQAVTLTGSERAGASVAENAGLRLKKTVLELGGSDAFIVCEDADFEKAVRTAVQSRLLNGGQSCISAKRFFVHEKIYDKFRTALLAAVSKLKQGNPREEDTDLGPMARPDLADLIEKQVENSLRAGATLTSGGKRKQNFFEPTVLENIPLASPAFREELFGPVFTLFSFSSDEQAIHLANLSEYGLGAAVWSENRDRAEKMATEIAAGCIFINSLVRSDQRVPFGGIKKSGYGRELSLNGIREFVNVKTVWVD